MPETPRIGTIIAERRLIVRDSGAEVRVAIGVPRRVGNGIDWACPFRIAGAGLARVDHGYGIDAMQALTTALEGIRYTLDQTGLALGWNLGRGAIFDGETGFARPIPFAFGPAFTRRIERLVDRLLARESRREVQRLKRRAARRPRKAAAAR